MWTIYGPRSWSPKWWLIKGHGKEKWRCKIMNYREKNLLELKLEMLPSVKKLSKFIKPVSFWILWRAPPASFAERSVGPTAVRMNTVDCSLIPFQETEKLRGCGKWLWRLSGESCCCIWLDLWSWSLMGQKIYEYSLVLVWAMWIRDLVQNNFKIVCKRDTILRTEKISME